eukprot:8955349-Pyramimonas_sp.AAC.1
MFVSLRTRNYARQRAGAHASILVYYCVRTTSCTPEHSSVCCTCAQQFKEAVESCTKAMELDGTSAKALYRRAHAHISRADLELGEADLARAIELEPSNYQIKSGEDRKYQPVAYRVCLGKSIAPAQRIFIVALPRYVEIRVTELWMPDWVL